MTGFTRSADCMVFYMFPNHPPGCIAEFELFRQLEVIAIFAWLLLLALFLKTLARRVLPAHRKNNKAQV